MQAFFCCLCSLLLSLLTFVNANITLSNIPTSACSASSTSTVTYTTTLTLETGSQLLSAGNLWKQPGAQWTFALPESDVDFASLGAIVGSDPGNPGGASVKQNALNLNPFRSMWTLTIPDPVPQDPYDVYFEVATKVSKRDKIPVGVKFRLQRDSGQYSLDVEGTLDCNVTPSVSGSSAKSTNSSTLASSQATLSLVSPSSQFSTPGGASSFVTSGSSPLVPSIESTTSNTPTFSPSRSSRSISSASTSLASSSVFASFTSSALLSSSASSNKSTTASAAPSISSLSSNFSISPTTLTSPIALTASSPSLTTASQLSSSSLSSLASESLSAASLSSNSVASALVSIHSSSVSSISAKPSTTIPLSSSLSSPQILATTIPPLLSGSVIASSCTNNVISPVLPSWSIFNARGYMSSLLSAAEPSGNPKAPLPGASLIHSDVNPPGAMCTYTAHCDPVGCSSVKDSASGSQLSVQRFLAYTSIVNFNNYLNAIQTALLDSGTISSLLDANLVTTFFTNKAPDAAWWQIMAIFTPMLSVIGSAVGTFLGPLGQAAKDAGEAFKVLAQVGSSVTAGNVVGNLAPVVDKRFSEYASIADYVGEYLKAVVAGVDHAYENILGTNASITAWTGTGIATDLDIVRDGYFGAGAFVDSDYTLGLNKNLLQNFVRVFTYKAINFAWIDSGCFIMYVPYNRAIKGLDGNVIEGGIDKKWCQTKLTNTDHLGTLTVCDAPGGMARIINSDTLRGYNWMGAYPQGFDANFAVLPGENLDIAGAIRGSVSSWLTGDFGYDASNPYNESLASGAGLSIEEVEAVTALKIAPETAGFFNLPVCETFDLRWFPPTANSMCVSCSGFGGTPGSTKKFMDVANSAVKKALQLPPDCTMGYEMPICVQNCPTDEYGPVHAQQNAAGYSPGWCGIHVIQYQKNEGSGADTSQYRLTATIYDGESININVPVNGTPGQNTYVQAPDNTPVAMTSRLPSPVMVSVGPTDDDVVWFEYPGNSKWGSNDQGHHCNFGKYDSGKREGDCGFTCA